MRINLALIRFPNLKTSNLEKSMRSGTFLGTLFENIIRWSLFTEFQAAFVFPLVTRHRQTHIKTHIRSKIVIDANWRVTSTPPHKTIVIKSSWHALKKIYTKSRKKKNLIDRTWEKLKQSARNIQKSGNNATYLK